MIKSLILVLLFTNYSNAIFPMDTEKKIFKKYNSIIIKNNKAWLPYFYENIITKDFEKNIPTEINNLNIVSFEIKEKEKRTVSKEKINTLNLIHISFILLVLISIIIAIIYWNIELKKRIKKALFENKKHETLLYHYSKHNEMKDLVGNISHQWKQPINELSGIIMLLETKMMLEQKISKEELEINMSRSRKIIDFMAETVDTFNDYYNITNLDEKTSLNKIIDDVIFMLKGCLNEKDIEVKVKLQKNISILSGNANSLKQVILSIINNAKDVIKEREIQSPKITISIKEKKSQIAIYIKDNAGGIKEKNFNKIFEMSYSDKKIGSGIGLYISKKIIEEKFNGKIYAQNYNDGACFNILIPKTTNKC